MAHAFLPYCTNCAAVVTAQTLAERLGVSVRSVYRDIDTLRQLGADIDNSASGVGFTLRAGFFLPPLAFDAYRQRCKARPAFQRAAQLDDALLAQCHQEAAALE